MPLQPKENANCESRSRASLSQGRCVVDTGRPYGANSHISAAGHAYPIRTSPTHRADRCVIKSRCSRRRRVRPAKVSRTDTSRLDAGYRTADIGKAGQKTYSFLQWSARRPGVYSGGSCASALFRHARIDRHAWSANAAVWREYVLYRGPIEVRHARHSRYGHRSRRSRA